MHELIRRQVPADTEPDDGTIVVVRPDLTVHLSSDETLRWHGLADTSMLRYNRSRPEGRRFEFAWNLVEPAEILITDARVIYRADTLSTKAGMLAGFREGAMMRLRNSSRRLRPDAFAGHVRFGWVANVIFARRRKLGMSLAAVSITTLGWGSGPLRLTMTLSPDMDRAAFETAHMLAAALASNIARHRLATNASTLSDHDVRELERQRDAANPVALDSQTRRWDLPGAALITAMPLTPTPRTLSWTNSWSRWIRRSTGS